MDSFLPGIYRHFKGHDYELLMLARHSETEEDMVVYRPLYGEGGVWVRPARMWNEPVPQDGRSVPRFRYLCGAERPVRIAIPCFAASMNNYTSALARFGAEGVLLRELCTAEDYDGMLLPGGEDLDPALYGQENRACRGVDPALDALQIETLRRFAAAGKPILGICRGIQVINVAFGGTLVQDLSTSVRHTRTEQDEDSVHPIEAAPGSLLEALYGRRFCVNSAHHQAADAPGAGLRVVARGDDGAIEALAHESLPLLGLQFHPERMCFAHRRGDAVDGGRILERFVMRCREG